MAQVIIVKKTFPSSGIRIWVLALMLIIVVWLILQRSLGGTENNTTAAGYVSGIPSTPYNFIF